MLPVIQRILIHTPEREFWRADDVRFETTTTTDDNGTESNLTIKQPPPPPRELSWQKLRWSISLYSTPRAVGWNIGSRRINAQREEMRKERLATTCVAIDDSNSNDFKFPKAQFVVSKLAGAFICYIAWDFVMVANRKVVVPLPGDWWSLDNEPMLRILWLEILMGITVYAAMTMQFDIAAAVGVGFVQRFTSWR